MKISSCIMFILAFVLAACGPRVIYKDRVETVSVPVLQPCVSGPRPDPVKTLREKYPDWYEKSPKQQAELLAMQIIEHANHSVTLNAATSACP